VLYTDGLVERRGETLDQGLQRLADVAGASAAAGADPLAGRILTGLEDAAGADDIAIIVARLLPPELRALIPALPTELRGVRRDVARWAAASALPEDQLDDLQLAVGEAIANSVEHGYRNQRPGDVDYRLTRLADGSVEVLVQDWGAWRPPPGDPGHRGRGLLVMRGLSSSFDIDEQPSGTTVRFRIPAPVPPRPVSSTPPPVVLPGTGPGAKTATLSSTTRDDTLVLRPEGDLDLDGARSIGTGLVAAVRTAAVLARVELDLRATSYLSSAGVALLLRAVDAAHDTRREVHTHLDRDSGVARIIALTGADMLLRLQYVD
jgi:anti-anti-sigma factor